jgi:hypothetical protein
MKIIDEKLLHKLGFKETDDNLIREYTNSYKTVYRLIFEGYAYVLYIIHNGEEVPVQDFQLAEEFEIFFKILSRDSIMDL